MRAGTIFWCSKGWLVGAISLPRPSSPARSMLRWAAAAESDAALAVPANSHSDALWRYVRNACIPRFVVLPITVAALIGAWGGNALVARVPASSPS